MKITKEVWLKYLESFRQTEEGLEYEGETFEYYLDSNSYGNIVLWGVYTPEMLHTVI